MVSLQNIVSYYFDQWPQNKMACLKKMDLISVSVLTNKVALELPLLNSESSGIRSPKLGPKVLNPASLLLAKASLFCLVLGTLYFVTQE